MNKSIFYINWGDCRCRDRAQTPRAILVNFAGQCAEQRIVVADAHRDGKRFVVRADEPLAAYVKSNGRLRLRESRNGAEKRY
jgi:hypothetical protein